MIFGPIAMWATVRADGKVANEYGLMQVQKKYGLSDEEMQKLAAYSKLAFTAWQESVATGKEKICAEKVRYGRAEDFGAALDGYARDAMDLMEKLGREAATKLGPGLFAKIIAPIRSAPVREDVRVDKATEFRDRGAELDVEVQEFCGPQR